MFFKHLKIFILIKISKKIYIYVSIYKQAYIQAREIKMTLESLSMETSRGKQITEEE